MTLNSWSMNPTKERHKETILKANARAPFTGVLVPSYNYRYYQGLDRLVVANQKRLIDLEEELSKTRKKSNSNGLMYRSFIWFLVGGLAVQTLR